MVDEATGDAVREVLGDLRDELAARLRANRLTGTLDHSYTLQMRFVGQAFEVDVPLSDAEVASLTPTMLADRFDEANRRMYLHSAGAGLAGKKVEIVGFRAGVTAAEQVVLRCRRAPRPARMQPVTVREVRVHEDRGDAKLHRDDPGRDPRARQRPRAAAGRRRDVHPLRPAGLACGGRCRRQPGPANGHRHWTTSMTLDPVDYAVISQALLAAAREMGTKLVRSAYSNIVREARDASCAILDPRGHIVAQSEMVPMQLGSMNTTLRACLGFYPAESLTEDDFLVNNHPFHGGQHLQDVFIFRPVFVDGELIAFAGSTAHHLDLGGGSAGLNAMASDVYQEGLLLPPLKFSLSRDWNGGNFERLLAANIRVPDLTLGDFNAQFAAKAIGIERIRQLCAQVRRRHGEGDHDRADRLRGTPVARGDPRRCPTASIRRGRRRRHRRHSGSAALGARQSVTVAGDEMEIDFAGTCDQVGRNINSPIASTQSAVMSCIKGVLLGGDVPFNEGSFRPVSIAVPYGSILNPRPPAPVRARMLPCYRAYDAVMKALAQVVPEQAIASGFDNALITCLARLAGGRYRVCLETSGGGFGASAHRDGADGIAAPLSNTTNSPVEAIDMEFDYFRIVGYELNPDSFGHGLHRGGLGMRRTYEMLEDDVDFSLYGDRFEIAPEGLAGGTAGALSTAELIRDGRRLDIDLKRGARLRKGDRVVISTSGGAGYGSPGSRDRDAVARDVTQRVISAATAATVYGLAVNPGPASPAPRAATGPCARRTRSRMIPSRCAAARERGRSVARMNRSRFRNVGRNGMPTSDGRFVATSRNGSSTARPAPASTSSSAC